jgi:N-acetylneuraminate synthase
MIHLDPDNVYIIAEAGVNHNGERDLAFALVEAAADAGADAVKFQTFNAKKLAAKSAPKAAYQNRNTDANESQLTMLQKLELSPDMHKELQSHANVLGIEFISTAFDVGSLGFLVDLGIPFFKIPSGELTNGPLLWRFAKTGKPLVVSTGMATLSEVELGLAIIAHGLTAQAEPAGLEAVWRSWSDTAVRATLDGHVSLLHCTSQYPTPMAEVNLRAMDTLEDAFGLPVGYSDHTEGDLVAITAVARGAKIIEKHFTTDRTLAGPDHAASLEPVELKNMIEKIRGVEQVLGTARKAPMPNEWDSRQAARQQVVVAHDIPAGHVFTRQDLTTARCGHGLPAVKLWDMIGQTAARDYQSGQAIDK